MRITVIPQDKTVVIDGESYGGINLSNLDSNIHAIQWYDTDGEVEIKDARGRMVENREITSFDEFASVILLWEEAKLKAMQDAQAVADAQAESVAKAIADGEAKVQAQAQEQQALLQAAIDAQQTS
jgi:hypothetical protein